MRTCERRENDFYDYSNVTVLPNSLDFREHLGEHAVGVFWYSFFFNLYLGK
jgi:hypothetical protein